MKGKNLFYLLTLLLAACLVQSCKEDIDTSDRYTFKLYTVASYLQAHDSTYSEYIKLLGEVQTSGRSASTVLQLMSARGNYTVFAPNNKAIQDYLDSLYAKGIINAPSWDGFPNENVLDSIQKIIVFNSIIDGKDDNTNVYQSSSFPNDGEEFPLANMNDRKLTIAYDEVQRDSMVINGVKDSKTKLISGGAVVSRKNRDIVVINGYIHEMLAVIAPSNQSLGDLLKEYKDMGNEQYSVMAELVLACGLQDTLSQIKDEVYETRYQSGELENVQSSQSIGTGYLPEHRKYGFTIFAETNDFWTQEIGKDASSITAEDVKDWVVSKGYYPNALDNNDYADPKNVLNQFITYHILPMRIPVDKLVIHYNEKGFYYKPAGMPHTVPVWEIYTTMGERRLLKLYEGGRNAPEGIYINRFPNLDNGRQGTYFELSCDEDKEGVKVNTTDVVNLINGYIYQIDKPLTYDQSTRENFQKQRLRYDVTALFPEFMNNSIRATWVDSRYVGMPCTKTYNYLEGLEIADGTNFCYLPGFNYTWYNFQGDEFNVTGRYEMTFTLPPVPMKGIYEIRYAVQNNSDKRGMCQVYFGSDKNYLYAIGIPLDLRIGGNSDILGWEADSEDDDYNAEVDKKMRNNGFMKGPQHYHAGNAGSQLARAEQTTTRRIIVRQEMDPEKTYYLKFKSVLDNEAKEFYMDYLEFCAKEVYDNPQTPEDIW